MYWTLLRNRIWPVVLILSGLLAGLAGAGVVGGVARQAIMLWFLLVCPGMAFVPLFGAGDPIARWTLAVALSLTLDALVSMISLYSAHWSMPAILGVLLALTFLGALAQLTRPGNARSTGNQADAL